MNGNNYKTMPSEADNNRQAGKILVTRHAVEQFREKVVFNWLEEKEAQERIAEYFFESRYVSDNENGILFRNETLMIEFIAKRGKIVTLFPIKNLKTKKNHRINSVLRREGF